MKKAGYLLFAILGNGFGSALMYQTHQGMSAWGASAANLSRFLSITPGLAFLIISAFFYTIAMVLRRKFVLKETILSILFLLSFSTVLDATIYLLPSFESYAFIVLLLINVIGLGLLLLSISVHIKINIAVHPMDVYLKVLQEDVFKSVTIGTYAAYASAFLVAIGFGLLAGGITDIGIGTVLTILCGGLIMGLYDKHTFTHL
jgi:uncharacterized membrane protein YczE